MEVPDDAELEFDAGEVEDPLSFELEEDEDEEEEPRSPSPSPSWWPEEVLPELDEDDEESSSSSWCPCPPEGLLPVAPVELFEDPELGKSVGLLPLMLPVGLELLVPVGTAMLERVRVLPLDAD